MHIYYQIKQRLTAEIKLLPGEIDLNEAGTWSAWNVTSQQHRDRVTKKRHLHRDDY